MLTQTQRNAVFTHIGTAYTIGGTAYTALKTYKEHWSGELGMPVIALEYKTVTRTVQGSVGRRAEWDTDRLALDVFAQTDVTNGVHGKTIVNEIVRELELWFKASATALLYASGMSIGATYPAKDLSFLEEKVYRLYFEVDILYKLI